MLSETFILGPSQDCCVIKVPVCIVRGETGALYRAWIGCGVREQMIVGLGCSYGYRIRALKCAVVVFFLSISVSLETTAFLSLCLL